MFVAEVVGPYSLASVIVICVVLIIFLRSRTKNLTLSIGNLHAEVKSVQSQVRAVDVAVNSRPPLDSTISEDIAEAKTTLASFIVYQHEFNHAISSTLVPVKGMLPILLDRLDHISTQLESLVK